MSRVRVACLVSGGKDSLLAATVAWQWGWQVSAFVTLEPDEPNPHLFHHPNTSWVRLQAEAAGVSWRPRRVKAGEDESEALSAALKGVRAEAIVSGALASEFQRTRFERVCHGLGLKSFAPLWHHEPRRHLRDLVAAGIRCRFVHVAAEGLDASWLGRELDEAATQDLLRVAQASRLHVAGEGGEYETFTTDAPMFRRRIEIEAAETQWRRDEGTWRILKARLAPKHRLDPTPAA